MTRHPSRIFARLSTWLGGAANDADADFQRFYESYHDARKRGDTRGQAAAYQGLRDAQTARLQRAIRWRGSR